MDKKFEKVSDEQVAKYDKIINILVQDILNIDKYLITDESSLNDFRTFRANNGKKLKNGMWEFKFYSYNTEQAKKDGMIKETEHIFNLKRKDREKYKIVNKIKVNDAAVSKDEELIEIIFKKFNKRPCTIMFSMPIYKLAEFLSN